ncbi:hypothetical protein GCM10009597_44090 [Peribacillus frigoritolerans]
MENKNRDKADRLCPFLLEKLKSEKKCQRYAEFTSKSTKPTSKSVKLTNKSVKTTSKFVYSRCYEKIMYGTA